MTASFQALLERAIATRGRDHPVWEHNSKTAGRRLAESVGVRVPALLGGPASVESLTPPDHPFVLKPVTGSTAQGVFLLVPEAGKFRELLSGRLLSWVKVKEAAYKAKHQAFDFPADRVRHPWILEELIGPPVPDDWKAYCFGGRVELFRQIHREGRRVRVKWWTPDFSDAGEITDHWTYDPELSPPFDEQGLVDAAELIAPLVDSPFIRVDLYDDAGPVFGEITPHPAGGRHTGRFVDVWDRRLGEAWLAAEASPR